jgi:hypothetical protein
VPETSYNPESIHKISRPELAEKLQVFVGQRWLKIPERQVLLNLWPYYLNNYHFVDSYLLSQARVKNLRILSFDRGINKVKTKSGGV